MSVCRRKPSDGLHISDWASGLVSDVWTCAVLDTRKNPPVYDTEFLPLLLHLLLRLALCAKTRTAPLRLRNPHRGRRWDCVCYGVTESRLRSPVMPLMSLMWHNRHQKHQKPRRTSSGCAYSIITSVDHCYSFTILIYLFCIGYSFVVNRINPKVADIFG